MNASMRQWLHILREILLPEPNGPVNEASQRWYRINGSVRRDGYV